MDNQQATQSVFKIPNTDALVKNSSRVFKLLIAGVIGVTAWIYLLPFLTSLVFGSIEFIAASVVAVALGLVVTRKKFWLSLNYYAMWITEKMLSMGIEMNRWNILNKVIDDKETELNRTKIEAQKIRGESIRFAGIIKDKETIMGEAGEAIKMLNQSRPTKGSDIVAQDRWNSQFSIMNTKFINAKSYIDKLKPMQVTAKVLADSLDKITVRSEALIYNSRETLKSQKDLFDLVQSGSTALSSANRALSGNNSDTEKDAAIAMDSIMKEIGNNMGIIQNGLEQTSKALETADLNDAAKMSLAAKIAEQYSIEGHAVYSDSITDGAIALPDSQGSGNRYLDLLK